MARKAATDKQHQEWSAHRAVQYAISTGELEPSDTCMECGWKPRAKRNRKGKLISQMHAHHYAGYSPRQRLNVVWLCKPCHELEKLKANHGSKQAIEQATAAQNARKKRHQ